MSEEQILKLSGIKSPLQLEKRVRQGLSFEAIDCLVDSQRLTTTEVCEFIPARTLARRKREGRLSATESDVVSRLARILSFAEEVFGSREKASAWLRTPNRALEGQHPLNLLRTDVGCRLVENILGRLRYGVYS